MMWEDSGSMQLCWNTTPFLLGHNPTLLFSLLLCSIWNKCKWGQAGSCVVEKQENWAGVERHHLRCIHLTLCEASCTGQECCSVPGEAADKEVQLSFSGHSLPWKKEDICMLSCARMSSQSYIRKPGLTLTWGSLGIFKTPSDSMKEVWHMKRKKKWNHLQAHNGITGWEWWERGRV